MPPEPFIAKEGFYDVSGKSKVKCPQQDFIMKTKIKGQEDCLMLNVYVPELAFSSSLRMLPVMVWIHGGGFTLGNDILKAQIIFNSFFPQLQQLRHINSISLEFSLHFIDSSGHRATYIVHIFKTEKAITSSADSRPEKPENPNFENETQQT